MTVLEADKRVQTGQNDNTRLVSGYCAVKMAPFGFEPKTDYLEGSCSIQLSYGVETG